VLSEHVDFGAVGANQAREFRCEIQESANRGRSAASGAEFEHLAEEDKGCNRGCCFEIDRNDARHGLE